MLTLSLILPKKHRFALTGLFSIISLCLFQIATFAQPTISGFSPVSGSVGSSVTISGTNFNTDPASNIVYFGAARATVTAASSTSLTVTVPVGTTYRPISVTTSNQTGYSSRPFLLTFANGGNINKAYFGDVLPLEQNASEAPNEIFPADIDGDGRVDIIMVDRLSSKVEVYRNTSAGPAISFASKIVFDAGTGSEYMDVADMNGDGKLDIVTGNDNNVSILINSSTTGTISFAPKMDVSVTGPLTGVAVADFDKDGRPDIVTISSTLEGTLSYLRNTTSGGALSFAPKTDIAITGFLSSIAAGDIDGDSKADIVCTNMALNAAVVIRNTSTVGNISFSSTTNLVAGSFPASVKIGDIDGDAKADIVVGNVLSNNFMVYRNTATSPAIGFAPAQTFAAGDGCDDLTLADLNGDGKLDIIAVDGVNGFYLFQGNSTPGNISLLPSVYYPSNIFTGINTADFDGDGRTDIMQAAGTFRTLVWKNKAAYPQPLSFTPTQAGEGTEVTITGANFIGVTAVKFGGVAAQSFTVENSTSIKAIVGPGASGEVAVTGAAGDGKIDGFEFIPAPSIASFNPTSSGSGGVVTITGANFTTTTQVKFGGVAASGFVLDDDNTIRATVGTGSTGVIEVVTLGGIASANGFTYLPNPVVTSFTPTSGGNGTVVTITGSNFNDVTSVSFGGVPALSFTVVNSNTITATVGDGASGVVAVTSVVGTGSLAGFIHLAPIITSFSPGSANNGATITITGVNLTTASAVSFGNVPATSFTVVNATTITAIVANGASGDVNVTTNYGIANANGFVYTGPPVITEFTPVTASVGAPVTITGLNFTNVTGVSFGGTPAISFQVVNPTTIIALVSNGASGNVTVTDANGNGTRSGFTFVPLPTITSFSPAFGTTGSTVTIQGTNFNPTPAGNAVYFGAAKAIVTAATPTQLTVTVPPGATFEPISVLANNLRAYSRNPFRITFNNNGVFHFDESSFSPPVDFNAGVGNTEIAISDIDTDGKVDITGVTDMDGFLVARNTGDGVNFAFGAPSIHPSNPGIALLAVDFDGDGKPDMASGVTHSPGVNIVRNTSTAGTVSFTANEIISSGGSSWELAAGDIDGDGKPDIVAGNHWGESIEILRNISIPGSIRFMEPVSYPMTYGRVTNVAVADMDGDGKQDIIVLLGTSKIVIYRNLSTPGVFNLAAPVDLGTGGGKSALIVGDMNADGKPDIAACPEGYSEQEIVLQLNTSTPGNLGFTASTFDGNAGYNINEGMLGDLNGDGKPELILTNGNFIKVYQNISTSSILSFAPAASYLGSGSSTVGIADLNNDGKPELITYYNSYYKVFTNQVGTTLIHSITPTSATTGETVTITGANFHNASAVTFGGVPASSFTVESSTSIKAVVALGATGDVTVTTPLGNASISGFTFIPGPLITSFSPTSGGQGTVVTITGSNFVDVTNVLFGDNPAHHINVVSPTTIIATVDNGGSGDVRVSTAVGTTTASGFTFIMPPAPVINSIAPGSGTIGSTVIITGANFNSDLTKNIVRIGGVVATVTAATTGSISFIVPAGTATEQITVTNTQTNLTGYSGKTFTTTTGTGIASFTQNSFDPKKNIAFNSGLSQFPLFRGDFDDDGKQDFIYGTELYKNSSVTGNISFVKQTDFNFGTGTFVISVADLDGDGKLDVTRDRLSFRNTSTPGNISFASPSMVGFIPDAIGDLDGDGRPDVIGRDTDAFVVVRNTSSVGSISFSPSPSMKIPYRSPGGSGFDYVALHDLDGDGKLDIIVPHSNNSEARIFRNTSDNNILSFAAPVQITLIPSSRMTFERFYPGSNGDLVVSGSADGGIIYVYRNNSTPGNFAIATRTDLPVTGINDFVCNPADIDGDGKIDIVSANGYTNRAFSLLKNVTGAGALTFQGKVDYGAAGTSFSRNAIVADLDQDGLPDVASAFGNEFAVYRNAIPIIHSFTPGVGGPGTSVTITGSGFVDVSLVRFGTTPAASFTVNSPTTITAVVGNGASGDIQVTTAAGLASKGSFQYNAPTPVIDIDNEVFTSIRPMPNPARSFTEIRHPAVLKPATISIYDVSGKQVLVKTVPANTKKSVLNVSGLASGIYKMNWQSGVERLSGTLVVQ